MPQSSVKHPSGYGTLLPVLFLTTAMSTAAMAASPEIELRRNLAWQIGLESVGFSPGLIDGRPGSKTRLATREFQRVRGLPITGELDKATADALKTDPDQVIGRYTIVAADLAEIGPVPKSWKAKSQLNRLGHQSLDDVIAERFHCHTNLLRALNPGRDINQVKSGDKIVVPAVAEVSSAQKASKLQINLSEKVIRVIGDKGQLIALFHCSVAADKAKLPRRDTTVVTVAKDPVYVFDPAMWPEVKEPISSKLTIPPGPRNPVGRCWIGLGLPGYGIHGTPHPELIGKTGSHGCIRLANWDALRLAKMVQPGTPVDFVGHDGIELASAALRK